MTRLILMYLLCLNLLTFLVFGIDKWKAQHGRWRISEASLLTLAVIGGSLGAWLGMKTFHHKTLHRKFALGVPLILVLQVALLCLCSCRSTARSAARLAPMPTEKPIEHSPHTFLVMYDKAVGKEPLLEAIKKLKVTIVYDYGLITGMALRKPDDLSLEETMQHFRGVRGVTSVEYDHIYRLTDPVRPKLYTK